MLNKDIVAIIITGLIGLIVIVFAVILLSGRGANLLAGFNTLSDDEKKEYDEKALSKFVGKIFLPIGIMFPCIALGAIFKIVWLPIILAVLVVALIIFAAIYCNTGNRFKK